MDILRVIIMEPWPSTQQEIVWLSLMGLEIIKEYLFTVKAVEHGLNWGIIIVVVAPFIKVLLILELLLILTRVEIFWELVRWIEYIFMSITVQPGVKKEAI